MVPSAAVERPILTRLARGDTSAVCDRDPTSSAPTSSDQACCRSIPNARLAGASPPPPFSNDARRRDDARLKAQLFRGRDESRCRKEFRDELPVPAGPDPNLAPETRG